MLISSASRILHAPLLSIFSPGDVVYSLILSCARLEAWAPLWAKCGSQMRISTYAPLRAREMNSGHMRVARCALSDIVERVLITKPPKAEQMTAEATGN